MCHCLELEQDFYTSSATTTPSSAAVRWQRSTACGCGCVFSHRCITGSRKQWHAFISTSTVKVALSSSGAQKKSPRKGRVPGGLRTPCRFRERLDAWTASASCISCQRRYLSRGGEFAQRSSASMPCESLDGPRRHIRRCSRCRFVHPADQDLGTSCGTAETKWLARN